ncbi:carbohydrate ABC transporter permease [Alicyclobacillus fastidiosus]|uniref:carbohydrate ABC transporter permease n=1 Tax=Alicyclobacillus fastidiosus TaxID=392011 RepID=UPI002DD44BD7|nr:carbohydrate ABC transporter permease [Alicyclobacillus fastidiosus]
MAKPIRSVLTHAVLIACSFVMVYPILWMLSSSFKPDSMIFSTANLIPTKWTFQHYIDSFSTGTGVSFGHYFLNSIFISAIVVVGSLMSASLTGFAFARLRFKPQKVLFGFMLGTMMLPLQIVLIPQYIIFHQIGWVNTFLPLTVPSFLGTTPFFIYLMVQFVRSIPKDLDEASVIDGCSTFRMFWSVILPLTRPALITISIFAFYWTWNDFFSQSIYLTSSQLLTVPVGLSQFLDVTGTSQWGDMFAMSIMSVIPVFIIFMIFQRYLVEGIATQGLKG